MSFPSGAPGGRGAMDTTTAPGRSEKPGGLRSRPNCAHPLFAGLVRAAIARREGKPDELLAAAR
jgi:hypothetical protein